MLASLALYHAGLGGALETNGDLSEALAQYEAELEIRQRLADKDPSNVTWQRRLKAAQDRVAKLKGELGPPTGGPEEKPGIRLFARDTETLCDLSRTPRAALS